MTTEFHQSKTATITTRRGKRVGPESLEAKRAAALRQAAQTADAERREAGLAQAVSFAQLLRDAITLGTIPDNAALIKTLEGWIESPALSPVDLSRTGTRLVIDVRELLRLAVRVLRERNGDELIQQFLHHVHLSGRVAGIDLALARWRERGRQRRQQRRLHGHKFAMGGWGKVSIWRAPTRRQEIFVGGEHSRIEGVDARATASTEDSAETRLRRGIAKDAKALLRILQLIITSADFRGALEQIQKAARHVISAAEDEKGQEREVAGDMDMELAEEQEQDVDEDRDEDRDEPSLDQPPMDQPPMDQPTDTLDEPVGGFLFPEHTEAEPSDLHLHQLDRDIEATAQDLLRRGPAWTELHVEGETEGARLPIPSFEDARHLPIMEEARSEPEVLRMAKGKGKAKDQYHDNAKPKDQDTHKASPQDTHRDKQQRTAPQQHRHDILASLQPLFRLLARNSHFARALRDFYFVLLRMRSSTGDLVRDAAQRVAPVELEGLRYDANFRAAQEELLALMQRFASNVSLAPVLDHLRALRRDARSDYELRDFFGDWRALLRRCTGKESERFLASDEYWNRGDALLRRTQAYFAPGAAYRARLEGAHAGLGAFADGLRRDRLTRDLGRQLGRLVREDVIGAGRGERVSLRTILSTSSALRPDLLNDLRYHILPKVLRSMQAIPLPRIEVVSGGTVLVLEDLIVPTEALVPMQVELRTSSHLTMNPRPRLFQRTAVPSPTQAGIRRVEGIEGGVHLKLTAIFGHVRNVRFTLDRSQDWPRFVDQGLADLRIGGRKGLSILIDLITHPSSHADPQPLGPHPHPHSHDFFPAALSAHRVRVRIDSLSLSLHDSLHDSLYRILSPLIAATVKRRIEVAIRNQILNVVFSLVGALARISPSVAALP